MRDRSDDPSRSYILVLDEGQCYEDSETSLYTNPGTHVFLSHCSFVVRAFAHGAMGRRVDPSCGGPIELFLVSSQCSTTGCNKGRGMCYPFCGMMHIKEPLLLIGKSSLCGTAAGFLSQYLSGPLPYVRRHITVNKMC